MHLHLDKLHTGNDKKKICQAGVTWYTAQILTDGREIFTFPRGKHFLQSMVHNYKHLVIYDRPDSVYCTHQALNRCVAVLRQCLAMETYI